MSTREHVRCPQCGGCLTCGIHTSGVTCNGTSSTRQEAAADPSGPVAALHRIANEDIGGNAPWLAEKLHAFAFQLAAEMRGECQLEAVQRAGDAERKLAAIKDLCHDHWEPAPLNPPVRTWVRGADILAVIDGEAARPAGPPVATATAPEKIRLTVNLECGHEGWIYADEVGCEFAWCGECKALRTMLPSSPAPPALIKEG